MESYVIGLFMSGLFHLEEWLRGSSHCNMWWNFLPFLRMNKIPSYVYTPHFVIHSSVSGRRGCFHCLAFVNCAAWTWVCKDQFETLLLLVFQEVIPLLFRKWAPLEFKLCTELSFLIVNDFVQCPHSRVVTFGTGDLYLHLWTRISFLSHGGPIFFLSVQNFRCERFLLSFPRESASTLWPSFPQTEKSPDLSRGPPPALPGGDHHPPHLIGYHYYVIQINHWALALL